jgi:hypothetical protein
MVQLWVITAGWRGWPQYTNFYSVLAGGFIRGQTNLPITPARELLALPDPYDPRFNSPYRLHDALLYNGKYYLYWGPVPALFVALGCRLFSFAFPEFGDQYIVFVFLVGAVILATVLIFQARAIFFPNQPATAAVLPVLSLALGTPVLFMFARAAIYEAAIAGGQFFLIAGLLLAWLALRKSRPWLFGVAASCWALSIGSRISLLPAVAGATAITAYTVWRLRTLARRRLTSLFFLFLPLIVGGLLMAWYNYTRFGSVTEFGLRYQLAAQNQHAMNAYAFSSWRYVIPNFLMYLITPPYRIWEFPYVLADPERLAPVIVKMFHLSRAYNAEPIVGILWSQPFLLFGIAAVAAPILKKAHDPLLSWLTLCLLAVGILGFCGPISVNGATMRYLIDLVPSLTILAALGYWHVLEALAAQPRGLREVRSATRLVVTAQCILGFLLSFTGYYNHFTAYNAPLMHFLRGHLPWIPP